MNIQIPAWYDRAIEEAKQVNISLKNSLKETFFKEIFDESLCGTCAIGSFILASRLKAYGAVIVSGDYVVTEEQYTPHCWVEIDDYIIDCTYTQFDNSYDVKVLKQSSRLGIRYKKLFVATKAIRDISSWDDYQSPKFWKLDEEEKVFVPSFRMLKVKTNEAT